ncbi:MAG: succinate dehydrogenase assembly factor 2 [Candidatus Berkiellales bacterium]
MSTDKANKEQLRWACRRGMLELDLFLLPFFDKYYDHLTEAEKETLTKMLKEPDPQLHAWFMGQGSPLNKEFVLLVEKIRKSHFHTPS